MYDVTIHYWAGARDAARTNVEVVQAATVADALDVARQRHVEYEFGRVLAVCSLLVDGLSMTQEQTAEPLSGPVTVEVLPPFAGG